MEAEEESNKEVKRKVYLCPEPTCVHHDPSRALGDLTEIKKHYSRKHGEKKWKCEKCSKKYAVQSDWKAHSKTCRTGEYKCDCGTLFSRRDWAFCDALAQESALHPTGLSSIGSQIPSPSSLLMSDPNANQGGFQDQFRQQGLMINSKALFHGMMNLSDQHDQSPKSDSAANSMFNLGFYPNGTSNRSMSNNPSKSSTNNMSSSSGFLGSDDQFNMGSNLGILSCNINSMYGNPILQHENLSPHMSATALLQKAAQIGSISSNNNTSTFLRGLAANSSNPITVKSDRAPQLLSPGIIPGCNSNSSSSTTGYRVNLGQWMLVLHYTK